MAVFELLSRGLVARVACAVLLLAWRVDAGWVPLSDSARNDSWPAGTEDPYGVDKLSPESPWVRISGHRHTPSQGYDPDVVGNLEGVQRLKHFKAARNHAMVAPVAAGTPPQMMSCMLDASSADLWLPSIRCDSCALDEKDADGFFRTIQSSTFRPETDLTWFGPAPRALRVVYGGGSAAGFVVNDTVTFGKVEIPDQTFLLAEEGGPDARRSRSWDGVCGIGRRGPEHGGMPMFEHIKNMGLRGLYVLSPVRGLKGHSELAHLAVGSTPDEFAAEGAVAWIPALTPSTPEGDRRGAVWMVKARVTVDGPLAGDFAPRPVRVLIETGTSYLLVPPHTYLRFVRSLFPNKAFDKYCGADKGAGGTIICNCDIRTVEVPEISFSFVDGKGAFHRFALKQEDLFEETDHLVEGKGNGKICIFQAQPRPEATNVADYFGVLGAPHESPVDSFGPGTSSGSPFGGLTFPFPPVGVPLPPDSGVQDGPAMAMSPITWPAVPMPDPIPAVLGARAAQRARDEAGNGTFDPSDPLQQILAGLDSLNSTDPLKQILDSLAHITGASVVKEVVVETLGDGTRCETDIVRAANGTVLSRDTELIDTEGNQVPAHGPTCASTEGLPADASTKKRRLDGSGSSQTLTATPNDEGEMWVLGDIFLRRYAVLLDFDQKRIGIAEPVRHGPGSGPHGEASAGGEPPRGPSEGGDGASVEALQDIQDFEADHIKGAVSHFLEKASRQPSSSAGPRRVLIVAALVGVAAFGAAMASVLCRLGARTNLSRGADRELMHDAASPAGGTRWEEDDVAE